MHPVAISFSIIRFLDAVQSCPDTIAICQEELLPRYCGKQGLRGTNSSVFWEENSKRMGATLVVSGRWLGKPPGSKLETQAPVRCHA